MINANNALNPSAKMRIIYTAIQENTKNKLWPATIIDKGDYIGIRSRILAPYKVSIL